MSTNTIRDVRMRGAPIVMYQRDDKSWKCYDVSTEDRIYGSYMAGPKCTITIGYSQYEIDFTTMKQKNVVSGFERKIKIERF
jgi:hypothetical protein